MSRVAFRRYTHDDAIRYTVYVLWLVGYSQRAIGAALRLRKTQVAGIIANSPYKGRALMERAELLQHLADLKDIRMDDAGAPLDGGRLDKIAFEPRPLNGRQKRHFLRRGKVRG